MNGNAVRGFDRDPALVGNRPGAEVGDKLIDIEQRLRVVLGTLTGIRERVFGSKLASNADSSPQPMHLLASLGRINDSVVEAESMVEEISKVI